MYAIFEDSGTQIKAQVGDTLVLDIRDLPENAKNVSFDRVLMVGGDGAAKIGAPYLSGAKVEAEILVRDFKGEKIHVWHFKKRKGFKKHTGHRQRHMKVKVTAIKG
ncbi:MAG: 50S ribosomal protein L21 [Phycisphaerales bacterium]|nr:50S ribosomal protein L21 [Phycisphaerales bacterium]